MAGTSPRTTKLHIRGKDLGRSAFLVLMALVSSVLAAVAGNFFGSDLSLGEIQGWSFSLGQVSFGLAAAFLALIIAQLGDFRWWWDQWRDRVPERPPPVEDGCLQALEKFAERAHDNRWLSTPDVLFMKSRFETALTMIPDLRMESIRPALQKMQHLLAREATWKRLVRDAGLSPILDDRFRAQAIAETFITELSKHYADLVTCTISLCAITLILGVFSLSPDPFFYGTIWSSHAGLDPDFSEINYKMFSLVLPAIVMMGWMTYLGYRVGVIFSALNRLKPDQFDKVLWQYLLSI